MQVEQNRGTSGCQEAEKVRDDLQEQGDAVQRGEERAGLLREEPMAGGPQMFLPGQR